MLFEGVFLQTAQNSQTTRCFAIFYKNRHFRTYDLNDVATANMLQNHRVLRVHFMVELKSGRDSRQHRFLKIVSTLAR